MPKKALKSGKNSSGFSLVETVVAVLLIAVVVTSVFSVSLTAKTAGKKTERRAEGLAAVRQIHEKVKGYVRAANVGGIPAPSGGAWRIAEDACDGGLGTCAPGCSALDICTHDVTGLLPATCDENVGFCSGPPVNGTVTYDVTAGPGGSTKVVFNINWDN